MGSVVSRRAFLRVVVVTGVATPVVAGAAGAAATGSGSGALGGRVEAAGRGRLRVRTSEGSVDVVAAVGARMYSGAEGEVADTGAFLVGDRVAAQGRRTPSEFLATSIGSIFTPLQARVTGVSQDGSVAETTIGPILLTAGRLPFTSGSMQRKLRDGRVGPGTVIDGLGWVHPGHRREVPAGARMRHSWVAFDTCSTGWPG